MVTDTPLDPDSWEYRGEYVPNEGSFGELGADWGNNHTHLHKFQDTYYLFYHGNVLEKTMKSNGDMNSDASGYRSLCVNKLTVNESTQKLSKVTMNKTGVSAIKNLNPYELQQAETMSTCGGVSYEDFSNISKPTSISTLGNDASRNLQVKMAAGSWIMLRKVDFGSEGATGFTLRAKGTGTLEIRLGSKTAKAAATVEFSSMTFADETIEVNPETFKGVKTVYYVFTAAEGVQFDTWQFSNIPTGIESPKDSNPHPMFLNHKTDLLGRPVFNGRQPDKLVIEQYIDKQGVRHTRKHIQLR
jgi:arabinoxylan arabinofuranohydrolase